MPAPVTGKTVEGTLAKLDSLVQLRDYFRKEKEKRLAMLSTQVSEKASTEEQYFINKKLYEEYYVYNSDSAMMYVNANFDIARKMNRKDWMDEWKIQRSFLLAATGMLKESLDALQGIEPTDLSDNLKVDYYGQLVYLYSHFGQYQGTDEGDIRYSYLYKEREAIDSVYAVITPEHNLYPWYKASRFRGTEMADSVITEMKPMVDRLQLDCRQDAMNAYVLAQLFRDKGDMDNYQIYIACSAMADVRSCNKDIASLEELGKYLFEQGDIERAYTYINYCFQNAQSYKDRVRIMGISAVLDQIHDVYQQRYKQQGERLQVYLTLVSVLSVVLLAALIYIYRQMRVLRTSRAKLSEVNSQLNKHVEDLSEAHTRLAEANEQLSLLNIQLQQSNDLLKESNYVKEEYIGYVFAICSSYINKLDEYRKTINRKIKANQIDEVKKLTDTPTMAQSELKEFYRNFDVIFLHVYPDFVSDFNALLRPEEQIVLKEGELLNTELRIYALVRLGINDSVKIAEFLHCSSQTVYNYRLKIRNKAVIPKEAFAETVRSLGKMQQ
ncbi:MAG: transcriptional regulator [Bacteroides sp.]|nr:transcriptional regulator [Bacteroides sp.]